MGQRFCLRSENRVWKITDFGQGFNFGPRTTSQNLGEGVNPILEPAE